MKAIKTIRARLNAGKRARQGVRSPELYYVAQGKRYARLYESSVLSPEIPLSISDWVLMSRSRAVIPVSGHLIDVLWNTEMDREQYLTM